MISRYEEDGQDGLLDNRITQAYERFFPGAFCMITGKI